MSEEQTKKPELATFLVILPGGYEYEILARGVEWVDSRVYFIGAEGAPIATFNRDQIAGVTVGE